MLPYYIKISSIVNIIILFIIIISLNGCYDKELSDKINDLTNNINYLNSKVEDLINKRYSLENDITKKELTINVLENRVKFLENEINKINRECTEELNQLKNEIFKKKLQVSKLFSDYRWNELDNKNEELIRKSKLLNNKSKILSEQLSNIEKKYNRLLLMSSNNKTKLETIEYDYNKRLLLDNIYQVDRPIKVYHSPVYNQENVFLNLYPGALFEKLGCSKDYDMNSNNKGSINSNDRKKKNSNMIWCYIKIPISGISYYGYIITKFNFYYINHKNNITKLDFIENSLNMSLFKVDILSSFKRSVNENKIKLTNTGITGIYINYMGYYKSKEEEVNHIPSRNLLENKIKNILSSIFKNIIYLKDYDQNLKNSQVYFENSLSSLLSVNINIDNIIKFVYLHRNGTQTFLMQLPLKHIFIENILLK